MKKFTILLAAAAMFAPALQAQNLGRAIPADAQHLSLLSSEQVAPKVQSNLVRTSIKPASAEAPVMESRLINTGIKIADLVEGRVSKAQLMEATQAALHKMDKAAPHQEWTFQNNVCNETCDNFTMGSPNSPYGPINGNGGGISQSFLTNPYGNLFGWGVYSCGGYVALKGNANEFRIINIDSGSAQQIGCWVGALQQNAGLFLNYIQNNQFLMNSSPTGIPYDGNIYFFATSSNAFKDKNNQVISAEIQLMLAGSNGQNDTDLIFAGIFVSGKLFKANSNPDPDPNPNPNPDPNPNPNTGGHQIGAVTNVDYYVNSDKQSFNVSFDKAANANMHELYLFNDVTAKSKIASIDLLNSDLTGVKGNSTDYYNPNYSAMVADVQVDAVPGGLIHYPVLVDGALGFYYEAAITTDYNNWSGFETSDYDLSATGGVCNLFLNHYALDGAAMNIMVVAYNKSTKKYEIIDEATLTGEEIQWDGWQDTQVTTDAIPSQYDLKHVYFAVAVIFDEEYQESEYAVQGTIIYFDQIRVYLTNIARGSSFSFLSAARLTSGNSFNNVPADLTNAMYDYNFTIRGLYSGSDDLSYGDWYEAPRTGTVYIDPDKTQNGVLTISTGDDVNAPFEYFNLQGQRVLNPAQGQLYIVKKGSKVSKRVIR